MVARYEEGCLRKAFVRVHASLRGGQGQAQEKVKIIQSLQNMVTGGFPFRVEAEDNLETPSKLVCGTLLHAAILQDHFVVFLGHEILKKKKLYKHLSCEFDQNLRSILIFASCVIHLCRSFVLPMWSG